MREDIAFARSESESRKLNAAVGKPFYACFAALRARSPAGTTLRFGPGLPSSSAPRTCHRTCPRALAFARGPVAPVTVGCHCLEPEPKP